MIKVIKNNIIIEKYKIPGAMSLGDFIKES